MSKNKFQISNFKLQIFKKSASICVYLWTISLLCAFAPLRETNAQVRPVYDYGAIGLAQILKRLNTTASVMHIGAHPDDEDSGLLAYLARGENARTAYLSLTRGDGGQNIIGSEQSESLGVIRTEELLQARRLDGAEQYFTRAFDFGFSKTLAEAKEKWHEKVILCDAVRAIRSFRPLVVISRFSGTPADGHGQHQFAGYIAPLAVKAAADPMQCEDTGAEWQVLKFYVSQGFRDTSQPTLRINTGKYDPLLGRSYFEIAMEGRSQHKTQEQGILELKGEQFSGLNLIESRVSKVEKETSIFDGINVSIASFPKLLNWDKNFANEEFSAIHNFAAKALDDFDALNPGKTIPALAEGLKHVRRIRPEINLRLYGGTSKAYTEVYFLLERKEQEFVEAIRRAGGIKIDALADNETIVPGEDFVATVKVFFPKAENVKVKEVKLNTPNGWTVAKTDEPKNANQGFRRETANHTEYFNVKASSGANPTQPYWLKNPRDGYFYRWSDGANQTLPFQSPLVSADVLIEVGGIEINVNQSVQYRFADDIRGEIRRDLNIVPEISVSADQKLIVVPTSSEPQTRRVVMSITNFSEKPLEGSACICAALIGGWNSVPASQDFILKNKGEKTSIPFELTIPARSQPGIYTLLPAVSFAGGVLNGELRTLAYPHIQTHRSYTRLKIKVVVTDLKIEPVKVGYIMGSGDEIPEAVRQMGVNVELLNETDLTSGDLSRFDTIIVGIRALQVRADFVANHQRLLDYVKNGGTMIVQYQPPSYQNLLPFPAQMGARVTDENTKVTILQPAHPVFNFPNKITDADFENWIQERNLNAFTTFDQKYTPLLESHDAGEAENKGGMVYTEIGKGKYIYCSYAFFRQLPAGVPGAYRLFANLLSLPKAK